MKYEVMPSTETLHEIRTCIKRNKINSRILLNFSECTEKNERITLWTSFQGKPVTETQ
jgi:hypothetical protein